MDRLITYLHQAFIWLNDPLNWTNPDGILARTAEHSSAISIDSL